MFRGAISTVATIWLLIGVLAVWQRDYLLDGPTNCGTAGRIALTVIAGPLNYAGVNPKVVDCRLPQPSAMG
jgi:energy-converting hydrogenase Eha subunit B